MILPSYIFLRMRTAFSPFYQYQTRSPSAFSPRKAKDVIKPHLFSVFLKDHCVVDYQGGLAPLG